MKKQFIKETVPLPEGMSHKFVAADKDGRRNVIKTVISGALMDDGRVLPLVYDGAFGFEVLDEQELKRQKFFEELVDRISEELDKHQQDGELPATAPTEE